uniref:Reverse transcriptase domain-containing protein n=1 Tax=Heterorhabditis bacteriophora TaxID=37862 RepID=A0A1I7XFL2_HETBA
MGGSPSVHQSPPDMMDHHHQYPDMNVIFKGIPKMIQRPVEPIKLLVEDLPYADS